MLKPVAIAAIAFCAVGTAYASSDDAWAEFQAEVETGCIQAAAPFLSNALAIVDPFGSESYGFAVVTGETSVGKLMSAICVMDKQTRAFEIGGELDIVFTPAQTAE